MSKKDNTQRIHKLLEDHDSFVEKRAARYMLNLLDSLDVKSTAAYRLCARIEKVFFDISDGEKVFPVKRVKKDDDSTPSTYYKSHQKSMAGKVLEEDWGIVRQYFQDIHDKAPDSEPDEIYTNLMRLAGYLGLDEDEKEILGLLYVTESMNYLDALTGGLCDEDHAKLPGVIAYMLDRPEIFDKAKNLLSTKGALFQNGFVLYEENPDLGFFPHIDGTLWEVLAEEDLTEDQIVGCILGKPTETDLEIKDFENNADDIDGVLSLVSNAVKNGEKGINILIYGPAGGGKTEMSKAIAKKLSLNLYSVGEEEDKELQGSDSLRHEDSVIKEDKKPTTGARRIAQLQRAQALLEGRKNAILLFDEVEDLLIKGTDSDKNADTESKIEVNRLLENNPVVTLWTGNDPDKFHAAVRQRYTFSVKVDYPPSVIRRKVWARQLDLKGVELAEEDIAILSRKYSPAPRMIEKACRYASITKGDKMKAIESSLGSDSRLSMGSSAAVLADDKADIPFEKRFISPEAAKSTASMIKRGKARKPFSLLIEGPSGAGATKLTQHIGEEMARHTVEVDMESLVIPEPMSSPASKIANVFNAAADDGLFVVFKNVEALADQPENDWSKWSGPLCSFFMELAQDHNVPFAVTTTKTDAIPDVFRYDYSDQIKLEALTGRKAAEAYSYFFGREAPPALKDIGPVVPGDFDRVSSLLKRMDYKTDDDALRVNLLKQQVKLRGVQSADNTSGYGFKFA